MFLHAELVLRRQRWMSTFILRKPSLRFLSQSQCYFKLVQGAVRELLEKAPWLDLLHSEDSKPPEKLQLCPKNLERGMWTNGSAQISLNHTVFSETKVKTEGLKASSPVSEYGT